MYCHASGSLIAKRSGMSFNYTRPDLSRLLHLATKPRLRRNPVAHMVSCFSVFAFAVVAGKFVEHRIDAATDDQAGIHAALFDMPSPLHDEAVAAGEADGSSDPTVSAQ